MKKEEFTKLSEEIYDRAEALVATDDEDKIMGAIIRIGRKLQEAEDIDSMIELSVIIKLQEEKGSF